MICFIIAPQNQNTILDRIAHEIGKGFDEAIYHYGTQDIPKADRYFVTHYSMLPYTLMQVNPGITPVTTFFTHDKGNLRQFVEFFNLCHSVIAESRQGLDLLTEIGVRADILHFVPEGGDNDMFQPHARTAEGSILVCGTNYADGRKNPDLVHALYKLTGRRFMFIGKDWPDGDGKEIPYKQYPQEFARCSVYLSCSKLEGGGPNSLIEAMHSNLVPVVSRTGNAENYIVDGYNGFIFDHDATPEYVASLIEKAYLINIQDKMPYNDVWQTVRNYTWQNYALNMMEIIMDDYSLTNAQELDMPEEDDSE